MSASVDAVLKALGAVMDPEVGLNVVDLGLVYAVDVRDGAVSVTMTMTSPACPLGEALTAEAEAAIRQQVPDLTSVSVKLVWDPPWDPKRMSAAAKKQLGWKT